VKNATRILFVQLAQLATRLYRLPATLDFSLTSSTLLALVSQAIVLLGNIHCMEFVPLVDQVPTAQVEAHLLSLAAPAKYLMQAQQLAFGMEQPSVQLVHMSIHQQLVAITIVLLVLLVMLVLAVLLLRQLALQVKL
jgi:hypothetical protein